MSIGNGSKTFDSEWRWRRKGMGSDSMRCDAMRWRAKGDEDLIRWSIASHQATAVEIGNEIQSVSKLTVLTRFLLLRFRSDTMLVVIMDPEVIVNPTTNERERERHHVISTSEEISVSETHQWTVNWVDQTLHTQIDHQWSATTIESDHAHLHEPVIDPHQSLKNTSHTATQYAIATNQQSD